MIIQLSLENYRGFGSHQIPLRPATVIVGKNNAGKSTAIEALRLVALVATRYRALAYRPPPEWLDVPRWQRGVTPSLRGMDFAADSVFHHYTGPPAKVTALFAAGQAVTIHIGRGAEVFAIIGDAGGGGVIGSRAEAARFRIPEVQILPQIGPVAHTEEFLTEEYVRRSEFSGLFSMHFRNHLYWDSRFFDAFQSLAESSWPGIQVKRPERVTGKDEETLSLSVRDGDFWAEVAAMGHGLQMWLQVVWFISRCSSDATVILDEPDVYMHAELQRRLTRLLPGRFAQTIIATHSTEVLSEVTPDQVLVLDRRKQASGFADSVPGLQRVVYQTIGSMHNMQIARLCYSRRFLLVEGQDIDILKPVYRTLYPDEPESLDAVPSKPINGWGGFEHATRDRLGDLRNADNQPVITYCILDRDYHAAEEIAGRTAHARKQGVQLHIWERKELENYLLVPAAITRVMAASRGASAALPSPSEVQSQIAGIAAELKQGVLNGLADSYLAHHRSEGASGALSAARSALRRARQTSVGLASIAPGKAILARLSEWTQRRFGTSLSALKIAHELEPGEVHEEVREVLRCIHDCEPFRSGFGNDSADPATAGGPPASLH